MSIKRINEFPEGSGSLSNDDVFLFMDNPSSGGTTKKIIVSEIANVINGGYQNTSSGSQSTVSGGAYNVTSASFSTIGGGQHNTNSSYAGTIAGGYYNIAGTGQFTAVGGGSFNTASADYATVGGGNGNAASGPTSTIGGGASNEATGDNCTVGGGFNNSAAENESTVAGGINNNASGVGAFVGGGRLNTASGFYSTVGGGNENTASAYYATVSGGAGAVASKHGMAAYSAGKFAENGDAQRVDYVLRRVLDIGTPATLMLDGDGARLTIPNNKALFATITIAGINRSGSAAAHYCRKVAIKNVSNTTSLIGTVSVVGTDVEDEAASNVTITADNTNKALQITVTGDFGDSQIRWVAHVEGVEIGL
jgi:hypothetical protein